MPRLSKLFTIKQIKTIKAELRRKHGNKCALCGKHRDEFQNDLALDHNHKTNKIRGLLCYRCNKFLVGRQTIESALQILKYLLKYDEPLNMPFDVVEELKK